MSETASFVDPVFLARFGLSRANVLDYFLHPLNPFRTKANSSNEVLAMQGIAIGILVQYGLNGEPLSPAVAETEYHNALARLTGEQYELLPPAEQSLYTQPSALYTIRHILRTNQSNFKILGVYYVVEGVIYKSPAVRSLMKANVTRALDSLSGACLSLSKCARYAPSLGYTWVFEEDDDSDGDDNNNVKSGDHDNKIKGTTIGEAHRSMGPVELIQLSRKRKRRTALDHRRPGERTAAEEEGIRATEAIDQILLRLSKSALLLAKPTAVLDRKEGGLQNLL